jgi:hypothetical protein
MTTQELEQLFISSGFEIQERFFDCVGYFWLSSLFSTPLSPLTLIVARMTRGLEGHDRLSRIMCDQVKYRLTYRGAEKNEKVLKTDSLSWVCPACKGVLVFESEIIRCSSCHSTYTMLDGKAPIFVEQTSAPSGEPIETAEKIKFVFRTMVWALYSLVYGPILLVTTAIAGFLRFFARSSNPLSAQERQ